MGRVAAGRTMIDPTTSNIDRLAELLVLLRQKIRTVIEDMRDS